MRVWVALLAVFAQADSLPPPYPRAGAAKLLENDRVIVWDIAWLKQQYPLHRHVYDLVGVYYTNGDRIIISPEGMRRPVTTKAWDTAFQLKGVTHIEEGSSDEPLRAVFAELKEPHAGGALVATSHAPPDFPAGAGKQLRDNERAVVWEFVPPLPSAAHHHVRDAVVVAFTGLKPRVSFVTAGTQHTGEGAGADRIYVFELK